MDRGLSVFELLLTFVPYLLDTSIQIWNAVEVNILTSDTEFKYPTPFYINEVEEEDKCEDGWTYFSHNKLCYKSVTNSNKSLILTPDRAAENCKFSSQNPSSNLASIHDSITNDFLSKLKYDFNPAWIGGYHDGYDWNWRDGTPWDYTNWGTGQPSNRTDESYLVMEYAHTNGQDWKNGQWNDASWSTWNIPASICQYDPSITEQPLQMRRKRETQNETFMDDVDIFNLELNFQYDPRITEQSLPERRKRETQIETFMDEDISNIDFKLDFSIKITLEGLVSLVLVQLPGIVLGFLGIFKAVINHGCSKKAVADSVRYEKDYTKLNKLKSYLDPVFFSSFHSFWWNFLDFLSISSHLE